MIVEITNEIVSVRFEMRSDGREGRGVARCECSRGGRGPGGGRVEIGLRGKNERTIRTNSHDRFDTSLTMYGTSVELSFSLSICRA